MYDEIILLEEGRTQQYYFSLDNHFTHMILIAACDTHNSAHYAHFLITRRI